MAPTTTVKQAGVKDLNLIHRLSVDTFTETFAAVNTPEDMTMYLNECMSLTAIEAELLDNHNTFYILYHNGQAAGYAKTRIGKKPGYGVGERAFELERIYILSQFQGRHLGSYLLDYCIDVARITGYTTFWLGVWEHNHKATAFYEKYGFKKIGSQEFLLGTDPQTDHIMILPLL